VAAVSRPTADSGRAFAGPADLAAMEACLAASWTRARPFVNATPGDLEWWIAGAAPGTDFGRLVHLWTDGPDVLAYGWLSPPGSLDWQQRAGLPADVRAALVDATLAWASEATSSIARSDGSAPPATLETWAMDADVELAGLLAERGWVPSDEPYYTHFYRRLDTPIDDVPALPDGYRLRHVRLPEDAAARVEVHRAAFAPSRMTLEKYATLAGMPRYAEEGDLVVEAPDGSLAAFAMVWWSPDAGVGEFEPVGTHPDHRRRGLGRAVNLAGLHRLRDLGAIDALVFSRTTNAASEGLYRSVGFEAITHHRSWTRPGR
jgi:ribosomal protein S18 acetylase RimI-like enzyme